jgi:hypothetical protein
MGERNLKTKKEIEMANMNSDLSQELVSLFDLRKSKARDEKNLTQAAFEAQRDIRYLTLMFCDGIPDTCIECSETESIKWDARAQKLIYVNGKDLQLLEAASKEIRVRMRPFLKDLVKKAKDMYSDD